MEGDWITILLFLFFFVILPILQGIGQRRKGRTEEQLPEADEWEPEVENRPARRRRLEPEEWDAEWEEAVAREQSPARQQSPTRERSAWEDLGLDDLFREPAPAPAPRPEPKPEPRPEPIPQPRAEPRWSPLPEAESRTEAPLPVPVLVRVPSRPERETQQPVVVSMERLHIDRDAEHQRFRQRYMAQPEPASRRPRERGLIPDLRDGSEVRRAIVLAEVLGTPRALREHRPGG